MGKPGDAASWRTSEFELDWGLAAINADVAYARGLTGAGIRLGVFDSGTGLDHPEFAGKDNRSIRIADLMADGTRCTNTTAVRGPAACFASDGDDVQISYVGYNANVPDNIRRIIESGPYVQPGMQFEIHGTHVAGTIAANRDGSGMHGVSFGSDLTVGRLFSDSIREWQRTATGYSVVTLGAIGPKVSAFQDLYAQMNAQGVRAINHSWGLVTEPTTATDMDAIYNDPDDRQYLNTFADGSRARGMIQVWAAGNTSSVIPTPAQSPIAGLYATLPRAFADIEPYWLSVVNVGTNLTLSNRSNRCGLSANWCLAAPGSDIVSTAYGDDSSLAGSVGIDANGNVSLDIQQRVPTYGYALLSGTSMAAPHVTGALGLLFERFPYLDSAQVRDVLLTTTTDLGAPGIDDIYGWGLLNLAKAIEGYGSLRVDTNVVMNQRAGGLKVWEGDAWDNWTNDIGGPGKLTKSGIGWLRLSGDNSFNGALVREGVLELDGVNTLTGAVDVAGGSFLLNGTLKNTALNSRGGIQPYQRTRCAGWLRPERRRWRGHLRRCAARRPYLGRRAGDVRIERKAGKQRVDQPGQQPCECRRGTRRLRPDRQRRRVVVQRHADRWSHPRWPERHAEGHRPAGRYHRGRYRCTGQLDRHADHQRRLCADRHRCVPGRAGPGWAQ